MFLYPKILSEMSKSGSTNSFMKCLAVAREGWGQERQWLGQTFPALIDADKLVASAWVLFAELVLL
jgi:hypothetical protein